MQNLPRNDLVIDALNQYFTSDINEHHETNDMPTEVYEEVYSTLYNIEIIPLNKKLQHQEDIINLLHDSIENLKKDKQFLQTQCTDLIKTLNNQKKLSFWKRRKSKQ
jgi:predicted RNase H-like nuclease (RuvC/YqgF family)